MLRSVIWLAAASMLIAAGPVTTEPKVKAGSTDPARMAAAEKLLDVIHYDAQVDRTMEAVLAEIKKQLANELNAQFDEPLPANVIAQLQDVASRHFRKAVADHRAQLRRATIVMYMNHFTTAELQRMAEIQADPVMIKVQQEMPAIAAESMTLGRGLVQDEMPKIREEAKAVLEQYAKDKEAKPAT